MTPEQLERLKQFRGARAGIAPPTEAVRDQFIENPPPLRGEIEQRTIPLRDDWLAFADEQKFISPMTDQAPDVLGRPLLSGQVTQVDPGFAMQDPTDMGLEPEINAGEFDFQGIGGFTPHEDLPPEDKFTDLDFLNALERRPGEYEVGSLGLTFADPIAPPHPAAAEYMMYSPGEPQQGKLTQENMQKARANRAALEAEARMNKEAESEKGKEYLRTKGMNI